RGLTCGLGAACDQRFPRSFAVHGGLIPARRDSPAMRRRPLPVAPLSFITEIMTVRPVNWHEGMFLRPHHFQVAERYRAHQSNLSEKWDLHYNWGVRDIELNLDGLAN